MNYRTTLLLSALLVGIIGTRIPLSQGCKVGEPLPGETEPDLNMTLSSNTAQVGGQIEITCDAGPPRFPITDPNTRPEPAADIQISHNGRTQNLLNRCTAAGISQCKFTLQITETTPKRVICRAANSGGECRIKFQSLTITTGKAINSAMSTTTVPAVIAPSTSVQDNAMSTTTVTAVIARSTTVQDNAMSTTSLPAVIAPSTSVQDNAMSTTSVPAVIAPSTTVQANSFTSMETPLMVASSSTPLATDSSSSLFLTASIVSRSATPVRFARSSSLPMESSLIPIPPIASSRALVHSDLSPSLQSSSPADEILSSTRTVQPTPASNGVFSSSAEKQPGEGAPRPISGDDEELENVKTLVIATLILVVITIILLLAALLYLVMKFQN